MADYELVCVFNPKAEPEKLIKKIEDWLKKIGAKVEKKEEWGERNLAYQIKKNDHGFFVFFKFGTEPSKIKDVSPKIRLESEIIRHLLVRRT